MPEDKQLTREPRAGGGMRFETARFFLRPLTPDDVTPAYVAWWNDPEVQQGLNSPPRKWDRQRAMKHVSTFNNKTKFHFGIFCKDTARLIGFFAVFIKPRVKVAKTNIVIGEKDYWGKGVVYEVREHMFSLLFESLNMEKIKGEIMGRNYPSIFNYKAQGFTCEGIMRSEIISVTGGRTDIYLFGLLRDEWTSRHRPAETDER